MRPTNLEALVPGLREARAEEHRNRGLAFSGVSWTVCGCELVPLTPRHRLELQLAGNAFECGTAATKSACFQFLWRLSPHFTRRTWWPFGAKRRILKLVRRESLESLSLAIVRYRGAMLQDLPGMSASSGSGSDSYVHWLAVEMAFYLRRFNGFNYQSFIDTPYLVLQQLFRAYQCAEQENPHFINHSDGLVSAWHRRLTPKKHDAQN